ncbi:MAG: HEPN domain-containing protein [Candidatus Jordarchaeales archaeon]
MREEILVFLERARKFEEEAVELFNKGVYDLSAFHIEQSLQLYLKYILAKELGYFPRTNKLSKLFSELANLNNDFQAFFEDNEIILRDIEDAYILSRYFPRDYSKREVEAMLNTLKKFKEKFREWIS